MPIHKRVGFELAAHALAKLAQLADTLAVYLPELDVLRERHGLRRLAFWHGGLNGVADMVVSLRRVMGDLLPGGIALAALEASMRYTNRPPYGLGIAGVASGRGRVAQVTLSHNDAYVATAKIVAWCVERPARDGEMTPTFGFAFELLKDADPIQGLRERGFDLALARSTKA